MKASESVFWDSSGLPPQPTTRRDLVTKPIDIWMRLRNRIGEQEDFFAVLLDVKNQLLGIEHVARGTVRGVEVHPRDVFRVAVRLNAAGIVLAHNHPSGDCTPSDDDIALTSRMQHAGVILGIPVVDHVVFSSETFQSMAETTDWEEG